MSERRMIGLAGAAAGVLAGVAALALARLPAGTRLPTHWNAAGEPDRYWAASAALFLPVLLVVGLSAVFVAAARLEPLQHRLGRSRALLHATWGALLGLMAVVEAVIAAPAFGWRLPATLPLAAAGVLLIVIGNALPKSRPGFFVGIRTPWAILDEDNWVATHRLGAWTFIAGGLGLIAAAWLPLGAGARQALAIASLALAAVPPFVWSFLLWRRDARAATVPPHRP